jgi:transposase
MAIQSLLYHGFGLKEIEYIKTEYAGGDIIFHVRTKENKLRCSSCGSSNVIRKGKISRKFKTVGIGLKPVYLKVEIQRLQCKDCKVVRQEKLKFADEKKLLLIR